jgi:hypothetical protein
VSLQKSPPPDIPGQVLVLPIAASKATVTSLTSVNPMYKVEPFGMLLMLPMFVQTVLLKLSFSNVQEPASIL